MAATPSRASSHSGYSTIMPSKTPQQGLTRSQPGEGEYEPLADRPLFGNAEARPRERMVNAMIVVVTTLLVFATAISAFVSGSAALDVFFVVCIVLFCISHLTLIVWYRHGDLDPKFKKLIYFNTLCIVLTCICGNIFFHT